MKDNGNGSRQAPVPPRVKTEEYFKQAFSNLWGEISQGEASGFALRVVARGQYDFLAICRKADSGGGPVVCFGSGESFWGALAALNATISKGAWKVDRYGSGGGTSPRPSPLASEEESVGEA